MDITVSPTSAAADIEDVLRPVLDGVAQIRVDCERCGRRLAQAVRYSRPRIVFNQGRRCLADSDWCRWCARPMSMRARRLEPEQGFIELARAVLGERETATPNRLPTSVSA